MNRLIGFSLFFVLITSCSEEVIIHETNNIYDVVVVDSAQLDTNYVGIWTDTHWGKERITLGIGNYKGEDYNQNMVFEPNVDGSQAPWSTNTDGERLGIRAHRLFGNPADSTTFEGNRTMYYYWTGGDLGESHWWTAKLSMDNEGRDWTPYMHDFVFHIALKVKDYNPKNSIATKAWVELKGGNKTQKIRLEADKINGEWHSINVALKEVASDSSFFRNLSSIEIKSADAHIWFDDIYLYRILNH